MDGPTFLRGILLTTVLVAYLAFGHLQNSWQPRIHLSSDGATWEAAHWSSYEIDSPPPSDNNETRVTISLTRVSANLVEGEDLSLSFDLVQQWDDPRLVVRNEIRPGFGTSEKFQETPGGPTVQNVEAIKGTDSPITIWKPTLGTDSFIRVVNQSRDETWL
ncbi:uncharacterized protein LOC118437106 [Folsomia candida]|uniref:uncharacterized protein LOC118437106 n=1 Tax=Folsomia candida TaxID=158441 RepID=UPI0016052E35|nr:uncharacterized protein LOC118437106 [Folsomia candida]